MNPVAVFKTAISSKPISVQLVADNAQVRLLLQYPKRRRPVCAVLTDIHSMVAGYFKCRTMPQIIDVLRYTEIYNKGGQVRTCRGTPFLTFGNASAERCLYCILTGAVSVYQCLSAACGGSRGGGALCIDCQHQPVTRLCNVRGLYVSAGA